MAQEQKGLAEKVGALSRDVNEIKNRPAKRWETVVGIVISITVTAVVTWVLAKAGL